MVGELGSAAWLRRMRLSTVRIESRTAGRCTKNSTASRRWLISERDSNGAWRLLASRRAPGPVAVWSMTHRMLCFLSPSVRANPISNQQPAISNQQNSRSRARTLNGVTQFECVASRLVDDHGRVRYGLAWQRDGWHSAFLTGLDVRQHATARRNLLDLEALEKGIEIEFGVRCRCR